MNECYSNNNYGIKPISDYGAEKIFGMKGSLLSYINTGNPYAQNYDSCSFNNSNNNCNCNHKKGVKKIPNALLTILGLSIVAGGIISAVSKKQPGKVFEGIKNSNAIKALKDTKIIKQLTGFASKIKGGLPSLFKKAPKNN